MKRVRRSHSMVVWLVAMAVVSFLASTTRLTAQESRSGGGRIGSRVTSPLTLAPSPRLPSSRMHKTYYSRGQLRRKIHDLLSSMADIQGGTKTPLPASLTEIIVINQPASGNILLPIIDNPSNKLRRRAINAFVQTWDTMNVRQVDAYLQRAIELQVRHRERYPQRSGAMIEMEYAMAHGWGGWPAQSKLELKTLTSHFVDNELYGQAFSYQGPMATTGWIRINDLSRGQHTAHLLLEYEFTHQGVRYQGRLKLDILAPIRRRHLQPADPDSCPLRLS